MEEQGLWTKAKDDRIKELREAVTNMKMEIFRNWIRTSSVMSMKRQIRRAESEIMELLIQKNMYYSMTCEGLASQARNAVLTEKCTVLNGTPYNFADFGIEHIMGYIQKNTLSDSELREISKCDNWLNIWCSTDKTPFSLPLSDEQERISLWTRMYSNIRESGDCPSDEVLQDDDAVDGWMTIMKNKNAKAKTTAMVEDTLNLKNNRHQEVFVPVGSAEEAKRIFDLNNTQGNMTVKSRMEQVKNSVGEVKQSQFSDVKFSRMLAANVQESNKMKGL